VSTHQEIRDPHLRHTVLPRRSPTSLRKWTATSMSLKRKAKKKLCATPLDPRVARIYDVPGTNGIAVSLRW
jgi:hypothetical protein